MGFIKMALIAGGVLLGLGAVGGVAAGVVSSQRQEMLTPPESHKPADQPAMGDEDKKDPAEEVTAESILKELSEKDVVIKKDSKETKPEENYAFDLENKTLDIAANKKAPEGYKVTVEVKQNQFDVKKLNDGELVINITVEKEGIKEEQKSEKAFKDSKEVTLTTFKKADKDLIDLLDKDSSSMVSEDYSLSLMLKTNMKTTFTNIDDLNKDGLKTLLTNTEKTGLENVTIEGKLKVTNITKEDKKPTIFSLSSSKENEYLKLVKQKDGVKTQALFKTLKTVNLLPNEVSVFVKNDANEESKKFEETLLEKAKTSSEANGFKYDKGYLELTVKKEGASTNETSHVKLNPFVYKAKAEGEVIKLPLGIKLTFGSGEESSSFVTSKTDQAKMLKDAGFKFHIYTRLLDDTETKTADNLKAEELDKGPQKLGKYLTTNNYKTPSAKPDTSSLRGELNAISNQNFYVLGPIGENLDKEIELETKEWSGKDKRNYILFADYSYMADGDESSQALKEKVLYTPNLSLINVNKTS